MMNTRPQTLGYSLADSPVGMLAFYYDKFTEWTHSDRQPEKVLTRDDMLDNVTLYWLTNTGTSSSRSYWDAAQGGGGPFNAVRHHEGAGRRDDLPRRDLSRSAQLGRAGLQEADLLERGRQGRSLRRVGAAAALRRGNASGVQIAALEACPLRQSGAARRPLRGAVAARALGCRSPRGFQGRFVDTEGRSLTTTENRPGGGPSPARS